jgi:hypothetical protein
MLRLFKLKTSKANKLKKSEMRMSIYNLITDIFGLTNNSILRGLVTIFCLLYLQCILNKLEIHKAQSKLSNYFDKASKIETKAGRVDETS